MATDWTDEEVQREAPTPKQREERDEKRECALQMAEDWLHSENTSWKDAFDVIMALRKEIARLRTHSPSEHTYEDGHCIRCEAPEECRPVEARTVTRPEGGER